MNEYGVDFDKKLKDRVDNETERIAQENEGNIIQVTWDVSEGTLRKYSH